MKEETKRIFSVDVVPSLYILVFGYAAVSKLLDYEKFRIQLSQSSLLTDYAAILVWALPVIETVLCVMLAIPLVRLIALEGSFLLMSLFSVYIFTITRFTEDAPCSCGGVLEKLSWNQHLVFNLILLVAAGFSIFWYPVRKKKESSLNGISG